MTTFGPYEVLDRIGAGATGTVYRARDGGSGRVVAVKELSAPVRGDPAAAARLREEARLLRGLSHPNIVAVHEFVEEPDRAYLVQEYVDGAGLTAVLAAHGRLGPESALAVLRGALTGLAFAHRMGVVHGDVSLDNILLTPDGTSKLIDFGVAGPAGGTNVAGTPAFLSPEAISGWPRTTASDVYSAGAVLYTLLAGRTPFPGADVHGVLRAHVEQPAPLLEGHGPELAALLQRALAKHPADRPPDAAALLAELEDAAARRYGADWPTRASLAGLAATTTGGLLAAAAGGPVAAAPVVAASSLAGGPAIPSVLTTPVTTALGTPLGAPPGAGQTLAPPPSVPPPATPAAAGPAPAGGAPPVPPPAPPTGVPPIPPPRSGVPDGPPAPPQAAPPPPGGPPPWQPPSLYGSVGQPARSSHRAAWIAGGAAAAVAAAVVVVLIIVFGGGSPGGGETEPDAAGAGGAAVEEPVEPAGPALPDGAYLVETSVTVEHPVWDPAGTTISETWTFDLACEEAPCAGSVTLPNGSGTVDFDGTLMQVSGSMQIVFDCYSNQTGELVPGSTLTAHIDFSGDLTAAEAGEGERPTLSGPLVLNYSTVATTLECESEEPGSSTHQATLTPA